MPEISVPRTPSPRLSSLLGSKSNMAAEHMINDNALTSPSSQMIGELTPPPSSQIRKLAAKSPQTKPQANPLASPPTTLKPTPSIKSGGLFGEVPSVESIHDLNEEQLRGLLLEVLPALTEARMSAAHAKLQHNLLSIENSEYIQRAEVEHEMIRREVRVLQEGRKDHGGPSASPRSPHSTTRHLDLALKRCTEVQSQNYIYEQRLRKAKKCIATLDGDNFELKLENKRLRDRIKANRDHMNAMRASGTLSINGTPLTEFRTPVQRTPRTPGTARSTLTVHPGGSEAAFNALVQAGEVMSGEANSVPSTPTRSGTKKLHHSHIRGAHSMSSLPTTPNRSKHVTAASTLTTPAEQQSRTPHLIVPTPSAQLMYEEEERRRSSRDSTISASENEGEAYDDDTVPASQASQKATSMLRRETVSAASQKSTHPPALTQGKLLGQVKKVGTEKARSISKRAAETASFGDGKKSVKKAKLSDAPQSRVGLGIRDLPNPAR